MIVIQAKPVKATFQHTPTSPVIACQLLQKRKLLNKWHYLAHFENGNEQWIDWEFFTIIEGDVRSLPTWKGA